MLHTCAYRAVIASASALRDGQAGLAGRAGERSLLTRVSHADLHGCEVRVEQAPCHALVGVTGVVVLESSKAFQLITRAHTMCLVPKQGVVLSFTACGKTYSLQCATRYLH